MNGGSSLAGAGAVSDVPGVGNSNGHGGTGGAGYYGGGGAGSIWTYRGGGGGGGSSYMKSASWWTVSSSLTIAGTGRIPGNTIDACYQLAAGVGGLPKEPGRNGIIVLIKQ
jgi:hypothetical protein